MGDGEQNNGGDRPGLERAHNPLAPGSTPGPAISNGEAAAHNADTVKLPPVQAGAVVTSPAFTAPGEGVAVPVREPVVPVAPRQTSQRVRRFGASVDADKDGVPDHVGVDDTGPQGKPDGKVDRAVSVEVLKAPGGRRVKVAVLGYADPEPALPRLPDVIRTNSEYDVSAVTGPLNAMADRFRGNWKRWQRLFTLGTPVLCAACFALGWWWCSWLAAPVAATPAPRSARVLDALYRRGHVPPEAEGAARKALIEDGVGDPEGGGR